MSCVLVALLATGCASPSMKGTPFYSGEQMPPKGPAADRVNLWPVLYYRAPVLSVLWPIGEKTDDHVAIRPLFSVYGLDQTQRVVSVLWPLSSIEPQAGKGYVFPVFWGTNSLAILPLYWHEGEPYGAAGGHDALFPLWSRYRTATGGTSTHVLWPIYHRKNLPDERGWRLWPLYGDYTAGSARSQFYAWPLGWRWHERDEVGHAFIPAYYTARDTKGSRFYSLPFWRARHTDGSGWQLALPLWFARHDDDGQLLATLLGGYRRDGEDTGWFALPLLAGGSRHADGGSVWALGPLAHAAWSTNARTHHVAPFYYRSRRTSGSTFLSLPWSNVSRQNGSGWQLAPPFCFRLWDTNSSALVTPLYSRGATADGRTTWRGVFPFVYGRTTPTARLVATPLGGYQRDGARTSWVAVPALASGHRSPEGSEVWAAAGLFHNAHGREGRRQHVLPLYYWNGDSGTFVSLPVARLRNADRALTMVPLLLSWKTERPARRDWWIIGPLAHLSSGPERGSSHMFPLYYSDGGGDMLLSPVYTRIGGGDDATIVIPPLLSAYLRNGDERDLIALLGLFRHDWGPGIKNAGHCIPFYAFEEDHYFCTPLAGRRTGDEGFIYPLTPIAGWYTGARTGGWVFPFWSRRHDTRSGRVDGTLLWGDYWRDGAERSNDLFPIYRYRAHPPLASAASDVTTETFGSRLSVLGVYRRVDEWRRRTPSVGPERTKETRLFPLWAWNSHAEPERGTRETKGSVLVWLYDYRHEVNPDSGHEPHDYRRSRVLWRLWHCERTDGDTTTDIFPAITIDRRADGFRKVSFLWRAFRYESDATRRAVDLLFVPVWRSRAAPQP
ncbi:MAG: hypothetical protein K8T26_14730 [Lentisphaerae bacterium]|nr:hypothetical protein [Lentisphaerota bacterium]